MMQKRLLTAGFIAVFVGLFLVLFGQSAFAQTGQAISALPDGGSGISASDTMPVVQGGATKRVTISQMLGLTGAVTSEAYSDFASAHAAAVAAGKALLLTTNLNLSADIAATVPVRAMGGTITQTGSYTLDLAAGFSAGNAPVFIGFSYAQIVGLAEADIRWWGAKQDSSTDSSSAIRNAVYAAPYVRVPNDGSGNYYRSLTAVELPSKRRISGLSGGRPQIYNDTSAAEAIFTITGTSGTRKEDVIIENLNLRNGTSTTGNYTDGKDVIRVEYADNVTIKDCDIPETQGAYAIKHSYTNGFSVLSTKLPKFTYTGIATLVETENTLLYDLDIGTPMTANYAQHYGTMTGGETLGAGGWGTKNYKVLNCRYTYDSSLGTSRWHAANSHGGENITMSYLTIKNYRAGVNIAPASGYWSNPILKGVEVTHCDIDRGDASAENFAGVANGILVQGADWTTDGVFNVSWNTVKGMGGYGASPHTAVPSSAAVWVGKGYDIKANWNNIEDYEFAGMYFAAPIDGVEGIGNNIKNVSAAYYQNAVDHSWSSFGIAGGPPGIYRAFVDQNKIYSTRATGVPQNGIYFSNYGNIIVTPNNQVHSSSSQITNGNWGYTAAPTTKYWKHGDPVWAAWGTANQLYATTARHPTGSYLDGMGMFGWFGTSLTVNATAAEYTATLASSPTTNYVYVPRGAWVTITGAGAGGTDLITQVLSTSPAGLLTLSDQIATTVTGANIVMITPTFKGVGSFTASATWDPASIAPGAGLTSSGITVTGAALGDSCEVSYSGDLQDLIKSCYVQSANTVEIRLFNSTGSAVDLASGTWRLWVRKY